MVTPLSPVPVFATIRRTGDTVTLKTKLPDVDPATVHASIVDGELVVTAHSTPPSRTGTAPVGHGPAWRPLVGRGQHLPPVGAPAPTRAA